jgi:hypothetical protein
VKRYLGIVILASAVAVAILLAGSFALSIGVGYLGADFLGNVISLLAIIAVVVGALYVVDLIAVLAWVTAVGVAFRIGNELDARRSD